MKLLITGSLGFIGSRLLRKLDAVTVEGNLLTCELPKNIDIIIHLAAYASVEESWRNPVKYAENLATTMRLVHTYPKARIIHASSCAAQNPESPYGFVKKITSDYLKLFHEDYVNLVFPNIYGADKQADSSHLSVVDIFKGKDEVTIYGDGLALRDYVHVDDIVDGIIKSIKWTKGEYFLASEKPVTVIQLAEGKKVNFAPARKEARESICKNTTPNWSATIDVFDYLND